MASGERALSSTVRHIDRKRKNGLGLSFSSLQSDEDLMKRVKSTFIPDSDHNTHPLIARYGRDPRLDTSCSWPEFIPSGPRPPDRGPLLSTGSTLNSYTTPKPSYAQVSQERVLAVWSLKTVARRLVIPLYTLALI